MKDRIHGNSTFESIVNESFKYGKAENLKILRFFFALSQQKHMIRLSLIKKLWHISYCSVKIVQADSKN